MLPYLQMKTRKSYVAQILKRNFTIQILYNNDLYATNLDMNKYSSFFKEYAFDNYSKYLSGKKTFDPNLSDQCCQIRAIWSADLMTKFDHASKLEEETLLIFGQGAVLSDCTFSEKNEHGVITKWLSTDKCHLEKILNRELSNKMFEKFFTSLKSNFSILVNQYCTSNYINSSKISLKNDILNHFSNKIYFSQKHKKIPFIPIFSAGYFFVKVIESLKLPVVILHRQYIVEQGNFLLNGVCLFKVIDNKIYDISQIKIDEANYVVIETYSISFTNIENQKYQNDFYKEKEFIKMKEKMMEQFNFEQSILSCEALHDLYHKQPRIVVENEVVDYKFEDVSEEYIKLVEENKIIGKKLGYGVNHWNTSKGKHLFEDEDIPFDIFHIYCSNSRNFLKTFESNEEISKKNITDKRLVIQ